MPGSYTHLLINGLSMGSGGGLTVGRELMLHLARARPQSRTTLAVITNHSLHEELKQLTLPPGAQLLWMSEAAKDRRQRQRIERNELTTWANQNGVDRVLQLNGQRLPGCHLPTLAHHQDPWPFRPEAWTSFRDSIVAFFKRRAAKDALKHAEMMGFTSRYLHDVITGWLGRQPRRSEVFYNGLPPEMLAFADEPLGPISARKPMLVSISNVNPYKRQDLVIRAMPELRKRPGMGELTYHIAGHVEAGYRQTLESLITSLDLQRHVFLLGRQSSENIERLYRESRAFVLMSVCESFGIPAIEAMCYGTPVVTANCCAMPEVCSDAAVLSEMDALGPLIDNLHRVLSDNAFAQGLRERGQQQAKKFTWHATASQMADALDSLA